MATIPWYAYRADTPGTGYGFTEPLCPGCYDKPDTNIAVPSGTPITALLPGTITSSQDLGKSGGGLSVTERLTSPLNKLAQYISYNYLGNSQAYVGEQVVPGTQIGVAGSSYGVMQSVGLGADPVWGHGQFLAGTGNPLLNPETQLLDSLKSGLPIQDLGSNEINLAISSSSGASQCPWYCALTPFATWGPCGSCQTGSTTNPGLQQIGQSVTDLVTPGWWARVGVILLGGILILIGAMKFMK
jgi:hypothetical protein